MKTDEASVYHRAGEPAGEPACCSSRLLSFAPENIHPLSLAGCLLRGCAADGFASKQLACLKADAHAQMQMI